MQRRTDQKLKIENKEKNRQRPNMPIKTVGSLVEKKRNIRRETKQHMASSSQPQHFFAAGCVFDYFAIAVIFIL